MERSKHLVIMAGGVGSRFWPVSTPERPKQFIDVLGVGRSLLQMTVDRFGSLFPSDHIWVVTSKRYRDIVREQLPEIPEDNILLEPCMRNTAPCIAYATWKIAEHYPDANIVFTPSDHVVEDAEEFRRVIERGLEFTAEGDRVLTLGMVPVRPDTGYGYIKGRQMEELNSGADLPYVNPLFTLGGNSEEDLIPKVAESDGSDILPVESFKEKPDRATAESYLLDGGYYWNAGIFLWSVETIKSAFRKFQPKTAEIFEKIVSKFYTAEEQTLLDELFPQCESISIDYAVMERGDNIYLLPADFGWSDLGTWGSLREHIKPDADGNVVVGSGVKLVECKNSIVHASSGAKMVLQGLNNSIVAEEGGVVMVCNLDDEQRIKSFSEMLND